MITPRGVKVRVSAFLQKEVRSFKIHTNTVTVSTVSRHCTLDSPSAAVPTEIVCIRVYSPVCCDLYACNTTSPTGSTKGADASEPMHV